MVAESGVRLTMPWLEAETTWWLEGRAAEAGRVVLVRRGGGGDPVDAVPSGFNVRTSVHEYGGGAYCIHRGTAFVSNFDEVNPEPQEFLEADDGHVVVTVKGGGKTKSGNELNIDSIWLYKVDDGKIEHAEFYGDTATAVKALA
jgi:hypothetical protein